MLIGLAIRSLMLPGAMEGVKWYLTPDFSVITWKTFAAALGQVFFSIGIASGGGFIYGSYLNKESNIPGDGLLIIGFDTLAALIAGMIMFPAIFALGLEPASGPSLLFVTMSNLFNQLPFAALFGTSLAPVAGEFGVIGGIVVGFLHLSLVMSVGALHGGMNLYNNGFSAGIIATLMVPVLSVFKRRT